ncbi:arylsulfatase A [Colletotrichum salicis]|uniref:Arylsulfatase A n=1 Tax=Colletotrichum salicis TaxID=1209931 RepID=A0A135UXR9_9PEZI|nr:arylsulfatase A [Colletotrichum salicis]
MSRDPNRPNVVLILADNLGWGELGYYGGGALRGAATPWIDKARNARSPAAQLQRGERLRSRPVRADDRPAPDPDRLSTIRPRGENDYATAHHGKWHLGDVPGRYPSDRGFDEWFGVPRTTDETQFTSAIGYTPEVAKLPYIMKGVAGQKSENVRVYDLEARRLIDEMLVEKSKNWLSRQVAAERPFFLYYPLVHLHFPTLPHKDFAGTTKQGDFADSMAEMDYRVGELLDHIDFRGIRENTVVIFASDNGPEFREPYRGRAGPWSGTYHTAMEGSLRVPFIIRWPGHVPEGVTSNEIVHVTDVFTTILSITKSGIPNDRPIGCIDQTEFFKNPANEKSERLGFLFYIKEELRAIKWKDWKLHLVWEPKVHQVVWPPRVALLVQHHQGPKRGIGHLVV